MTHKNYLPKFQLLDAKKRLYQIENPLIGLTGGIATGKSAVAALIRQKGLPVIDADQLVKSLYTQKQTIDFIQALAPQCVSKENNFQIDFKSLRQLFFSDKAIKQQVEQHIYSLLPTAFLNELKSVPQQAPVFYDVPLLFEKKLNQQSDLSVVVYACRETQIKRMMKRDQIEFDLAEKILAAQMSIDEKKLLADVVIENEGSLQQLQNEVELFLNNQFTHLCE